MSPRAFVYVLILFVALFGSGYAALAFGWLMPGPTVATYRDATGLGTITMGTNLPRPAWIALPRDGAVASGALVVSAQHPQGFGTVDIVTHDSLDDVRRFYLREFAREGFEARDQGIAPLNAASAAFLGVAGSLIAERSQTKDCVAVQIRTAEGWLIASRLVHISWYKTDAKFPGRSGDICLGLLASAKSEGATQP